MSIRMQGLILAFSAVTAVPLTAQESFESRRETVAQAVRRVGTGTLRLQFKARPGVCGSGQSMNFYSTDRSRRNSEWESECEPGPVRVAMDVSDGVPISLRFYVGGRWGASGSATDIGAVAASDAGRWFVRLAETGTGKVARDAITVSTLADSSTVWPTLLRIAKDDSRERELRKSAVFWLGQAASEATAALNGLVEDEDSDVEVRKSAVFALSQRPNGEGVPSLLSIARGRLDPRVRRQAIFWLGQSGDPRAVAYFEDVLMKP
jgi:PBS lyase HEAT-like repeat